MKIDAIISVAKGNQDVGFEVIDSRIKSFE